LKFALPFASGWPTRDEPLLIPNRETPSPPRAVLLKPVFRIEAALTYLV